MAPPRWCWACCTDSTAIKLLQPLRVDPVPAVRQQAAAAMWQLGSEQGLKDLVGWTLSRFPDDQMMGILGLAEPGNHVVIQHVRNELTTDWPEVKSDRREGDGHAWL